MIHWLRTRVLRFLRVPPEPHPPAGAPGSVKIFRAGKNYYRLRLFRCCWNETWVLIGLAISIAILTAARRDADTAHREREQAKAAATAAPVASTATREAAPATPRPAKPAPEKTSRIDKAKKEWRENKTIEGVEEFIRTAPWWAVLLLGVIKIGGIAFFIVQLPFSLAAVRLEYEQHWYIVTDRSLRIRTGLVSVLESTMSFANIQQVVVEQGPIQRLLGLANVRVQSAGGGSVPADPRLGHARRESLHVGVFSNVDNADEIRDLILARLKRFREAGLGDPEDARAALGAANVAAISSSSTVPATAAPGGPHGGETSAATNHDTLEAARELLTEARALRQTLAG